MNNNINISVIIPVYNCETYIERCVKSILLQTYLPAEIIIVDDGSEDASGAICDRLSNITECIKIFHKENGGVSAARNYAMSLAKGDWLAFVDADDVLPLDAFATLVNCMDDCCELSMGSVLSLGGEFGPKLMCGYESKYLAFDLAEDAMIKGATSLLMSGVWGKLYKSEIIKIHGLSFREDLQNGEDGIFNVTYLNYVERINNAVDKPPVYYLMRYEEKERVSAVSSFYPDFLELYVLHSNCLYNIASKEGRRSLNKNFYQRYIDLLIVYLVRAFAYNEFFDRNKLESYVGYLLDNQLVRQAIPYYEVKMKEHSEEIPKAILDHDLKATLSALKKRAENYNKKNQKKSRIKSVYRR